MALRFAGNTHYRTDAGLSGLVPPLTLSLWCRVNTNSDGGYTTTVGHASGNDLVGTFFREYTSANTAQQGRLISISRAGGGAFNTQPSSIQQPLGEWVHQCVVFQASGTASIYSATTRTDVSFNIPGLTDSLTISGRRGRAGYFSGDLAHTATWIGALSDAEVASLANGTLPPNLTPASASLFSYQPLDTAINNTGYVGPSYLLDAGVDATPTDSPVFANSGLLLRRRRQASEKT